jgi:hypothetical protein
LFIPSVVPLLFVGTTRVLHIWFQSRNLTMEAALNPRLRALRSPRALPPESIIASRLIQSLERIHTRVGTALPNAFESG